MARSDLLLSLVKAGVAGDQSLFRKTVEALIAEERARNHSILAGRLADQLRNGSPSRSSGPSPVNGAAQELFYELTPQHSITEMILPDHVERACAELVEEHYRTDLLRSYNLTPRNRVLLAGAPGNGKTSLAESLARQRVFANLSSLIGQTGGQCLRQAEIPEICYHEVLAEMPAQAMKQTVDRILQNDYSQLLRCEDVMFFRPFGQAGFPGPDQDDASAIGAPPGIQEDAIADAEPVVALIDGLPLENHVLLAGRLIIDDPDEHQTRYQPGQQRHGTAMASLILHGDLSGQPTSLQRPVYVRPIFLPSLDLNNNTLEVTPDDELLVDLIHRSVRRIKEGDGNHDPTAPSVKIINLSFGNRFQPFDRDLSPLARLLDWLS
jgi:DNA polymerase III delta prime subunit